MFYTVRKFIEDESGATAVEYGLIAVLICVALLGGAKSAGLSINNMWDNNSSTVQEALGIPPG
ncbi:MAG: Flp family type IVb pilin [Rhizobiaceae bacterium]|nr:Flp family type IVb pilin [Rhizobiaceae bacterium]